MSSYRLFIPWSCLIKFHKVSISDSRIWVRPHLLIRPILMLSPLLYWLGVKPLYEAIASVDRKRRKCPRSSSNLMAVIVATPRMVCRIVASCSKVGVFDKARISASKNNISFIKASKRTIWQSLTNFNSREPISISSSEAIYVLVQLLDSGNRYRIQ